MSTGIEFHPDEVRWVADRLDAMADRMDQTMQRSGPALSVVPAALDDVSRRATDTFNGVSGDYQRSYAAGVYELRKMAANLRAHTGTLVQTEDNSATQFARI